MIRIGLDIGSTTAKIVALNENNQRIYYKYKRHNAQVRDVVLSFLEELVSLCEGESVSLRVTGSVGMGFAERYAIPFVQEVVAAAKAIRKDYISTQSMIDIGGEDAKVVFFKDGKAMDLRMNGNCAGGTGAFIDQMAIILGVDVDELNRLALAAKQIYPIASRCGVFCKTDIQNLIAKNASREDIAASIFHAVAVQTVITLAHGYEIKSPVLFCGGPLTFIPALRKAFMDYLSLEDKDVILPEQGELLPALGTALAEVEDERIEQLPTIIQWLQTDHQPVNTASGLQPIFDTAEAYREWRERISRHGVKKAELEEGVQDVFIGIDSGSTTTKIVVLDEYSNLLYSFYKNNGGNPIQTVVEGLTRLKDECERKGAVLRIKGSCSTGYGEDLIKAAFQLHSGIIETVAHYMAAQHLDKQVSFILDIGGQDMKAIFVNSGVIDRIEINEACSSGCGSFIETFAKSLGFTPSEFAVRACSSSRPCDLGTRCTVFMNSKVKQVLREGATVDDIAAGLAYSVVKNCLYKVLKLKDVSVLGKHIVVQGGTMRSDAIVRAIEVLTGAEVSRYDCPELMGAFGCALYAMAHQGEETDLSNMLAQAVYTTKSQNCKGCENQCLIQVYRFENGRKYYSGNRCEKVFSNGGASAVKGENAYLYKRKLLFDRQPCTVSTPRLVIGIPRVLNMFEEYPFWHTLFTACGMEVRLSDASNYVNYERNACMVMSDNICFPAKLVHSHIANLQAQKVDRIFMPFVLFEPSHANEQNSFNCPIVTGYSAVVKSVQPSSIPLDSPVIGFKDEKLLLKQCTNYLVSLGVDSKVVADAFRKAVAEQQRFHEELTAYNRHLLETARQQEKLCILLAGRPYHTDPLIQHKVSDMLAGMGIQVLTDEVASIDNPEIKDTHFLSQWAYPNRIMKAAKWCAMQDGGVQFVQMTSFGCGPDAFITDEVRDLLLRYGKTLTLLKLDDINNVGSMKLRVRSLIESLKLADDKEKAKTVSAFRTTPVYDGKYRDRKILIPYFTSFLSPLIPSVLRMTGYDVENLPLSDEASCEWGLKYANNEVCYPATLIVGDVIKAFKSGQYDPARSVIAITQTGGQCRASNYLPLIKKALVDAGYADVPVVSLTLGDDIENDQPAFKINWLKILPIALRAILYTDSISKFYYASVVREQRPGAARELRDFYLRRGCELIESNASNRLFDSLSEAAAAFDGICQDKTLPRVGVVGEIYLKFNPFAQKNIVDWLIGRGIEVVPPILTDFFMQSFVNRKVKLQAHVERRKLSDFLMDGIYGIVRKQIEKVNARASRFRYFIPFHDIFEEAREAEQVVTLNAQFGEGWLLPAEMIMYARSGVNHIVSLQPFGCIANHIVSKGIEKRVKDMYPDINILSLDFESGVSDANVKNRLLLFIDNLKH